MYGRTLRRTLLVGLLAMALLLPGCRDDDSPTSSDDTSSTSDDDATDVAAEASDPVYAYYGGGFVSVRNGTEQVARVQTNMCCSNAPAMGWSDDRRYVAIIDSEALHVVDLESGQTWDRPCECSTTVAIWGDRVITAKTSYVSVSRPMSYALPDLSDPKALTGDIPPSPNWQAFETVGEDLMAVGTTDSGGARDLMTTFLLRPDGTATTIGRPQSGYQVTAEYAPETAYGGPRVAYVWSASGGSCSTVDSVTLVDPSNPAEPVLTDSRAVFPTNGLNANNMFRDVWFGSDGVLYASAFSLSYCTGTTKLLSPVSVWRLDGNRWVKDDDRVLFAARDFPPASRVELEAEPDAPTLTEPRMVSGTLKWIADGRPQTIARLAVTLSAPAVAPDGRLLAIQALADRLREQEPAVRADEAADPDTLHEVAMALKQYADDPALMAEFYGRVGPWLTERLPSVLGRANRESTDANTAMWDLEVFSKALGSASTDPARPAGFAEVASAFTTPDPDGSPSNTAWDRLAMLQFATVEPTWLAAVVRANALNQVDDHLIDFNWYRDPPVPLSPNLLVLAFRSLRAHPEAAEIAFSQDTRRILSGSYYHARADAAADQFGLAMESATAANGSDWRRHDQRASRIASHFIIETAQHPSPAIELRDSLDRIAASYRQEILVGASIHWHPNRESTLTKPAQFEGLHGVRPAFYLGPVDTYRFVHGFADSDEHSAAFDDAIGDLYDETATDAAVAVLRDRRETDPRFDNVLGAFGSLAGMQYTAALHVRGNLDEADQKARKIVGDLLSRGVGRVPTPQKVVAKYAWKAAKYAIGKGIQHFVDGPEPTRVDQVESANDSQMAMLVEYQVARALVDALDRLRRPERIPAGIAGENGGLAPVESIAGPDGPVDTFYDWLNGLNQDGKLASKTFRDHMLNGTRAIYGDKGKVQCTLPSLGPDWVDLDNVKC